MDQDWKVKSASSSRASLGKPEAADAARDDKMADSDESIAEARVRQRASVSARDIVAALVLSALLTAFFGVIAAKHDARPITPANETVKPRASSHGFTLIEMSIVLVIIGLIVGGILVGQSLITAATVRKQITQIQDLETQINTFRGKYDCLPGDCAKATSLLGSTDSAGHTITNGNGDGLIAGSQYTSGDCVSTYILGEPLQLFLQLNAARIGNYSSDGATSVVGTGFPLAALANGTGFFVTCVMLGGWAAQQPPPIDRTLSAGNVEVLGTGPDCNPAAGGTRVLYLVGLSWWNNAAYCGAPMGIPVGYAQTIDTKIDDGVPNSGNFGVVAAAPGCLVSNTTYARASNCNVLVGKWIGTGE